MSGRVVTDPGLGSAAGVTEKGDSAEVFDNVWKCYITGKRDKITHKFSFVQCKFCLIKYTSPKKVNCESHILKHCKNVPESVKDQLRASVTNPRALARALAPSPLTKADAKRQKVEHGGKPGAAPLTQYFDSRKAPNGKELQELRQSQLLFFAMCNVPFRASASPFFLDFVQRLRPMFTPAGPDQLAGALLKEEVRRIAKEFLAKIGLCRNVTLSVDVLPDSSNKNIYVLTLQLDDESKSCHVLTVLDLSDQRHTAADLLACVHEELEGLRIPPHILGGLVSDSPSVMNDFRRLFVEMPPYQHVIQTRCWFRAFALLNASVIAHPWAAAVATQAQAVVTYLRATPPAWAALQAEAEKLDIPQMPQSSNQTRVTSVQTCITSVLRMEPAFATLLAGNPGCISNPSVLAALAEPAFWSILALLEKLLQPFSNVIMAIQERQACLADVTRYMVYLGLQLTEVLPSLEPDYRMHVTSAFNKRLDDMDIKLCRLAMLLHPCYKAAVGRKGDIFPLIEKAVEIMQKRGCTQAECQRLGLEILRYWNGDAPYNIPCVTKTGAKSWWNAVDDGSNNPLTTLAVLLLDIVPTAGFPERVFSLMGAAKTKECNRMTLDTLGDLTRVRVHHQSLPTAKTLGAKGRDKGKDITRPATSSQARLPGPASQSASAAGQTYTAAVITASELDLDLDIPRLEDDLDNVQLDEQLSELYEAALNADGAVYTPRSSTELLLGDFDGFDMQSAIFDDLQVEVAGLGPAVVNTTAEVRAPTTGQFSAADLVNTLRARLGD